MAILAVLTARSVAVLALWRALLLRRMLLRLLAAGDERRQPLDIFVVVLLEVLRPRLKMLWLRMRLLMGLRLLVRLLLRLLLWLLLLARIKRLLLARRERLTADLRLLAVAVAIIKRIVGIVAARFALGLLLVVRRWLGLPQVLLGRRDQPEIMLGVLKVVLGRDRIAGTLRIARQLEVFLANVGCIAPDLHVRSVGLVHARQWILVVMVMMTTATAFTAVATPHALVVLTVSHGLLYRQPPSSAAAPMPPFAFIELPLSSSIAHIFGADIFGAHVIGAHGNEPPENEPSEDVST